MLSYILRRAQQFQRDFGVSPTVIYINPQHYEALCRENPELFSADTAVRLGFRFVILPSSQQLHPEAALMYERRGQSPVCPEFLSGNSTIARTDTAA